MILGLNSNVKYGGKIYHVQTEDSGEKYKHAISHLFLEGTILATERMDYSDLMSLPAEEREKLIVERMRKQHKTIVRKLTLGGYDHVDGVGDEEEKKKRKHKRKVRVKTSDQVAAPSVAAPATQAAAPHVTQAVSLDLTADTEEPSPVEPTLPALEDEAIAQALDLLPSGPKAAPRPQPLELMPEDAEGLSEDDDELNLMDDDDDLTLLDDDAALEIIPDEEIEEIEVEQYEPEGLPSPEQIAALFAGVEVGDPPPSFNVRERLKELMQLTITG